METIEKLSADEVKDLEKEVSVPYRVKNATVLSPGRWNGLEWTAEELRQAVEKTDFSMEQERGDSSPPNGALYYDHEDRSADSFVGQVENVRVDANGDVKTDLVVTDKQAAMNLEFGAPFGVSPKADGMVDERGKMQDFKFENFSLVVNPAVKTTWLNEDIETVLQDMSIHEVKYQGTTEGEWNSPNLEDFTDKSWNDLSEDEKSAVGRHFLISKSGFPAENFGDLALPVVEPSGDLSLNALQNAKARVGQVSGIDEDSIRRVSRMINNLANGNFDADFEEVDMTKNGMNPSDEEMAKHGDEEMSKHNEEEMDDGDGSEEADESNNSNEDTMVKNPMAEEEQETQEPETEESSGQEEETVENSENYVTAEELEDFKSEVVESLKQELGDDEEESEEVEDEGDDVEEAEADAELSQFEEFKQENPELSLSEAAERFEEENRDVEDKIEEMSQKFEEKISDLEEKLESKEEEVEELSEKVENPQRATQASGAEDGKDLREEVSELSDEELHAQIFTQMDAERGVTATKEMIHNE